MRDVDLSLQAQRTNGRNENAKANARCTEHGAQRLGLVTDRSKLFDTATPSPSKCKGTSKKEWMTTREESGTTYRLLRIISWEHISRGDAHSKNCTLQYVIEPGAL
jgi:hypothetical protein